MDLPKIYPITPETDIFEKLLTAITGSASNNFSVFQYRRKNLDESRVEEELDLLEPITTESNISVIINSYHRSNLISRFSGLHLNGIDLKDSKKRPVEKNKFFGISCHDEEEIKKAEILDADYIFLSPVNKTSSHQNQKPLGWKKFSELTKETNLPVYALGGLEKEDLLKAERNGAYGIAGISKFWSY